MTDAEFDALQGAEEFTVEELIPLPAKCPKCKRVFVGRDAIRAPSLDNCCCWRCHSRLIPHPDYPGVVDAVTARRRKEGRLF